MTPEMHRAKSGGHPAAKSLPAVSRGGKNDARYRTRVPRGRSSGKDRLKDRIKYNAPDFNAIQVKDVCFAPDGKHLVLVCTDERTKMNFIQSIDLIAK